MKTQLKLFVKSYIGSLLWSATEDGVPLDDQEYMDYVFSFGTLKTIVSECKQFLADNYDTLVECTGEGDYSNYFEEVLNQAAHDFILTRNGHGVGFWDRNLGEVGGKLTEYCEQAKEFNIYPENGFFYH